MAGMPMRYVFMVLGFVGLVFTFALKVNLGIAIVCMVNYTAINRYENETKTRNDTDDTIDLIPLTHIVEHEEHYEQDGPFVWSQSLQGIIVSSYFWGYLFGQIPGGRLAEDYSAKWTFYTGVSAHIIGTLLTPVAAYIHYSALIVIRILEGIVGGFTFPSMHCLLTKWAPPSERSIMASCIYNGNSIGTVVSLLLTGTIAHHVSWEAAFYILGGMGVPWMVCWPILMSETPLTNKFVKEKELTYLTTSLDLTAKKGMKVPWKNIFGSGQVWVLVVCHVATGWGFYMMLTQLPLYMKMVLKFQLDENGAVTALPFLCMFMFSVSYGLLADYLITSGKLSKTNVRKLSTVISAVIPAACFVVIPFAQSKIFAVALMCMSMMFFGGIFSGFVQGHIDLAFHFAATLISLTNTFSTITGIVVPIFVGWLIEHDPSIASWRIAFWITAGFYILQMVVFVVFAKSEEQSWNKAPSAVADD